jgi:hypothetical protein
MGTDVTARGEGPVSRARHGARDEASGGGPHEQGLSGPGDSLRCCRMDSADGLSSNYCKRLRIRAQGNPAPGAAYGGPALFR